MALPKITPAPFTNAHLQPQEVDRKNCLSKWEGETCFPLKTTPGLAVDYENRRARVEGLGREEGAKMLVGFAAQAPALKIDKEEAWGFLEMQKGESRRDVWVEIGCEESADGVSGDFVAFSDAQFQLETQGWNLAANSLYHIHLRSGDQADPDIYKFSSLDLVAASLLISLSSQRFQYVSSAGVATPIGIYTITLNEKKWESRDQYYERLEKGILWYNENENGLKERCFTPGRDLIEAAGCFAIGANTLMAAHASPVVVSFIPSDR